MRPQLKFIEKLGIASAVAKQQESEKKERKQSQYHDQSSKSNKQNGVDVSNPSEPEVDVEGIDIWDCVLIVVSCPNPYDGLLNEIQGLISLTQQYGWVLQIYHGF